LAITPQLIPARAAISAVIHKTMRVISLLSLGKVVPVFLGRFSLLYYSIIPKRDILRIKHIGTHKSGTLRVIHTAPAGCQMIVPFKGGEVKYVLSLVCRP
jgi:hypothetical protein